MQEEIEKINKGWEIEIDAWEIGRRPNTNTAQLAKSYFNKHYAALIEKREKEIEDKIVDYLVKICWSEKDINYFLRGISLLKIKHK